MAIDATTVARVKTVLGKTDSADDTFLGNAISAVSRQFEGILHYELEQTSRVEDYGVQLHQRELFLRQWPLVSVTSVVVSSDWDFANGTTLTADEDYRIDTVTGSVYFLRGALIAGFQTARVTYVAGLGTDTSNLETTAPDIVMAADLQVAEDFRRRDNPSTVTRGQLGKRKTFADQHNLLDRVRELLQPHIKYDIGSGRFHRVV